MYHPIPFLFWWSPSHFPLMRESRILYNRYWTQGPCTIVKYLTWTQPGTPNSVTAAPSSSSLWRIICMMRLAAHSWRQMSMISTINPSQRISLATILGPSHNRRIEANRYTIHLFFNVYYWSSQVLLSTARTIEWGLTVNQNQKTDYIRKQLWKDTSSIYEKSTHFLQLAMKLQCWTAHKGLYLPKKNAYTRLSLSLSFSPPLEERARGEVGGSWTLVGSNHLTAIFGQCILYPAGVWIVISSSVESHTGILYWLPVWYSTGTWYNLAPLLAKNHLYQVQV